MIPKSTKAADKRSYQPKAEMPSTQNQTAGQHLTNRERKQHSV